MYYLNAMKMQGCGFTLLKRSATQGGNLLTTNNHNRFLNLRSNSPNVFKILTPPRLFSRSLFSTATPLQVGQQTCAITRKRVGYWLASVCAITAGTVMLGGITRLTKAGLSMVDWHPFNELPPKNNSQWHQEFLKYQQYPEFKLTNSEITLSDFKWIWYMEYIHRTFGRVIGLSFFLPAGYFAYKGYFKGRTRGVILLLGGLILFQGGLGWYMVKSGLEEKPEHYNKPQVSHLRLASHLGTAFLFYSITFLTALHHLLPPDILTKASNLFRYKRLAYGLTGAVFTTAVSGALVAGLEAGLTYNSWPMMADRWIPSDIISSNMPFWKNFIQNSTTVQFDHRWLGQLTFLLATGSWLYSRKLSLHPRLRFASNLVMLLATFQLSLGITTLLLYVPKHLAATHQSGALALLTSSLWLAHELKLVRKIAKV